MPIGKIGQRRQVVIPKEIFDALGLSLFTLSGFRPYFGDVWRGLVSPVLLYRGDTHGYAVSASLVGTSPPLLRALHVPHRDRCCDLSRGSSRWRTRQPPPSGTRG